MTLFIQINTKNRESMSYISILKFKFSTRQNFQTLCKMWICHLHEELIPSYTLAETRDHHDLFKDNFQEEPSNASCDFPLFSEAYITQFYDSLCFLSSFKIQHFGDDTLARLHLIATEIWCEDSWSKKDVRKNVYKQVSAQFYFKPCSQAHN